jgi:DNA-binding transcriptional ArsR family regulator
MNSWCLGDAVLRIRFEAEDLTRIRLDTTVDPVWEMVFSRLRLCERHRAPVFTQWVRRVQGEKRRSEVTSGLRLLTVLSPLGPYFPDFLTPPEGVFGLPAAIEAIRATPRVRLDRELRIFSRTAHVPGWARSLASGDAALLGELGDTLGNYHRVAIEPYTDLIQAAVEADRAHRARMLLDRGTEGLLQSLRPLAHWRPPVLELQYAVDRDLHLRGRGLRLVPSYFCRRAPVALADPDLAPTLVYPVNHDYAWKRPLVAPAVVDGTLARLLGTTRAAVLLAAGHGATTTELAKRLGTSLASVSRHTAVLREAGLITTHRQGISVLHTATPLGIALAVQDANRS